MPDKMTKVDNKPAKHPGGRPARFKDPEKLQAAIDDYFNECKDVIPTIEGLAVYLDCDSDTIRNYEGRNLPSNISDEDKQKYFVAIKKARARCQTALVNNGLKVNNPAMQIFLLKNNYGYKDKQEIDTNMTGSLSIRWESDDDDTIDITPK